MRGLSRTGFRMHPPPARQLRPTLSLPSCMAAVGFQLADRVYGLDQHQAQFLAGQMQRRIAIPEPIALLADEIWEQSMLNPDSQVSRNIEPSPEQKEELLETLRRFTPAGDRTAWDALAEALDRELSE